MNPIIEHIEEEVQKIVIAAENAVDSIERKKRIKSLGFESAKITKYNIDPEIAKELVELKLKYPFYKFITSKQLKQICKKWGLVWGPARGYKGQLPEKNLQDIEKFKEDFETIFISNNRYHYYDTRIHYNIWEQFSKKNQKKLKDGLSIKAGTLFNKRIYRISTLKFEICAPREDFKKSYRKKGVKIEPVIKDDPIVVAQVRKGIYAIVTAWGPEASDGDVFNEILN